MARKEESEIIGEEGDKNDSSEREEDSHASKKTETNNQSQDQDVAAPKAESTEEGKYKESKSQSGNPNLQQTVPVIKPQNRGMRTKEQKAARVAKIQQQFRNFDRPNCGPLFAWPPGPPQPLFPYPGSGLPYNMCIPPFSNNLLYTLHRATGETKQKKKW